MKKLIPIIIVLAGFCLAASITTTQSTSAQNTRDCIYASGGWASVDCSAAVAYSAQLNANSRYVVQCTGNALFAPGSAASGQDADTSDGYLVAGVHYRMYTHSDNRYYSCLELSASNAICRHIECR